MKNLMVTALMRLAGATWATAQSYPSQTGQSGSSAHTSAQAQTTTVQGCLASSDGGFALTDKSGAKYDIAGDSATLKDHVGHEVEITGTKSEANTPTSTTGTMANSSARIDVSKLKHISETCSA